MTDFRRLLEVLSNGKVEFVIIGGVAAAAHGSARNTQDLDLVYGRDIANLERLAAALAPYAPYLRGAPEGLPFVLDARSLASGLNFTLTTTLGAIDLLGEVAGGGTFATLVDRSVELAVFGRRIRCVSLTELIRLKRAAGRPKDLEAIAELEELHRLGG